MSSVTVPPPATVSVVAGPVTGWSATVLWSRYEVDATGYASALGGFARFDGSAGDRLRASNAPHETAVTARAARPRSVQARAVAPRPSLILDDVVVHARPVEAGFHLRILHVEGRVASHSAFQEASRRIDGDITAGEPC